MTACQHQTGSCQQTYITCRHPEHRNNSLRLRADCDTCPLFEERRKSLARSVRVSDFVAMPHEPITLTPLNFHEPNFDWSSKIAAAPDALQYVWIYWHGGAVGDEIRFSVRSVEHFSMDPVRITIIGDCPPWYTGHFISKPKHTHGDAITDMFSKMILASEHPEIGEHCVWMMDDVYFTKPFQAGEVMCPRAVRRRDGSGNPWQKLKAETCRLLSDMGYSDWDFATHGPHYFRKSELSELISRFNLKSRTLIWEILYGNVYRPSPLRSYPWLTRITKKVTELEFERAISSASVLNHSSAAWSQGLRNGLMNLLSFPASCEIDGFYPVMRSSSRSGSRRPPHLRSREAYMEHIKSKTKAVSRLIR